MTAVVKKVDVSLTRRPAVLFGKAARQLERLASSGEALDIEHRLLMPDG